MFEPAVCSILVMRGSLAAIFVHFKRDVHHKYDKTSFAGMITEKFGENTTNYKDPSSRPHKKGCEHISLIKRRKIGENKKQKNW